MKKIIKQNSFKQDSSYRFYWNFFADDYEIFQPLIIAPPSTTTVYLALADLS